jgi:hypothetical protein
MCQQDQRRDVVYSAKGNFKIGRRALAGCFLTDATANPPILALESLFTLGDYPQLEYEDLYELHTWLEQQLE